MKAEMSGMKTEMSDMKAEIIAEIRNGRKQV